MPTRNSFLQENGVKNRKNQNERTPDKGDPCPGVRLDGLQEALKKVHAVQGIVLLDLIGRTGALLQQTQALLEASNADARGMKEP